MKEMYEKSLQMIKELNIKNETEYNNLLNEYFILHSETLKYMCGTRKFKKVIKIANKTA